jgi:uncharacterized membrane protein YhaH (DUF805 family)
MTWALVVVAVLFFVWVSRKSGPKEDQSYLDWLALVIFMSAVSMAASRLHDRDARDRALPWICLAFALALVIGGVVGLVRSRRDVRAREERAAERRARRETRPAE